MYVETALEANAQFAETGEPGVCSLDNPAMTPQPLLTLDTFASNASGYASSSQVVSASATVVALVGMRFVRPFAWSAIQTWRCGYRIQRLLEGHRIMAICARYRERQRNASRVYDEVPLAAELATVGEIRAGFLAPGGWLRCSIDAGAAPIDLVVFAQTAQHRQRQPVPHASGLPVA